MVVLHFNRFNDIIYTIRRVRKNGTDTERT